MEAQCCKVLYSETEYGLEIYADPTINAVDAKKLNSIDRRVSVDSIPYSVSEFRTLN